MRQTQHYSPESRNEQQKHASEISSTHIQG